MKNFRQTMGVEGGNLAVPTTPKSDNAEMKVEKRPTSHTANGYIRTLSAQRWHGNPNQNQLSMLLY